MKLEEWKGAIKECKKSSGYSGTIATNLKVYNIAGTNAKRIAFEKECYHCKHKEIRQLRVEFKEPKTLTIFETAVLFSLFCNKTLPFDYSQYHKCQAGKEFIENIEEVLIYEA